MGKEETEYHKKMGSMFTMYKDEIRLAGVIHESLSNGPGLRRVLFSQGCKHECEGCFNLHTHSFTGGQVFKIDDIVRDILENPMLRGVTFSGGDPLEQAEAFASIAKKVKAAGKNIWVYTGYTFEYVIENRYKRPGFDELLKNIDVLVDGKFDINKKNERLKFRGSSNQRIIDVKKSLEKSEIIVLDYDKGKNS